MAALQDGLGHLVHVGGSGLLGPRLLPAHLRPVVLHVLPAGEVWLSGPELGDISLVGLLSPEGQSQDNTPTLLEINEASSFGKNVPTSGISCLSLRLYGIRLIS